MVINMKQYKPKSNFFKITKMIQARITIATLVVFILFIISNSDFRMALFQSPLASISTMLLWTFFLANIIFTILDHRVFYKALHDSDEIQRSTYLDDLTGMPNRFSCDLVFQMYAVQKMFYYI